MRGLARGNPFSVQGQKEHELAWEKDPRRVAINQHMHRFHDGAALAGDTSSRYVQHELLHNDGKEWVARGKPLHRHDIGSDGIPSLEPVLVESAE